MRITTPVTVVIELVTDVDTLPARGIEAEEDRRKLLRHVHY